MVTMLRMDLQYTYIEQSRVVLPISKKNRNKPPFSHPNQHVSPAQHLVGVQLNTDKITLLQSTTADAQTISPRIFENEKRHPMRKREAKIEDNGNYIHPLVFRFENDVKGRGPRTRWGII